MNITALPSTCLYVMTLVAPKYMIHFCLSVHNKTYIISQNLRMNDQLYHYHWKHEWAQVAQSFQCYICNQTTPNIINVPVQIQITEMNIQYCWLLFQKACSLYCHYSAMCVEKWNFSYDVIRMRFLIWQSLQWPVLCIITVYMLGK